MKIPHILFYAFVLLLSSCTSYLLPSPDDLNEDLVVPLGKYDGERRYYDLNAVEVEPVNYERAEYFEGNFRGVEVELLVNWEKQDNALVMVASATAGQPVFAIKQQGRQLVEQFDYVEIKGLRYSWLLADYQMIHLTADLLNQQLERQSVKIVELEHHHQDPVVEEVSELTLVKSRYLLPVSDLSGFDEALVRIDYFAKPADLQQDGSSHSYHKITFENSRWKYHYVITLLEYSAL